MKSNRAYLWTYVFTLIIGILLLVFTGRTNLFNIIVVIIGVLFILPSVTVLFMGFSGRRAADGSRASRPWYVALTAIGGLVFGVLLVVMPGFFVRYLIYTLAVILILEGIAQITNISALGIDVGGLPNSWYIMPWLTVAGGVAMIIIGPERLANAATVVTGVLMVLYSVNGLMSAGAHRSARKRIARAQADEAEAYLKGERDAHKEDASASSARVETPGSPESGGTAG